MKNLKAKKRLGNNKEDIGSVEFSFKTEDSTSKKVEIAIINENNNYNIISDIKGLLQSIEAVKGNKDLFEKINVFFITKKLSDNDSLEGFEEKKLGMTNESYLCKEMKLEELLNLEEVLKNIK